MNEPTLKLEVQVHSDSSFRHVYVYVYVYDYARDGALRSFDGRGDSQWFGRHCR